MQVKVGEFIKDAEDAQRLVVGVFNGRPVYLGDVATVVDGPEEPADYVFFGVGKAWSKFQHHSKEAVFVSHFSPKPDELCPAEFDLQKVLQTALERHPSLMAAKSRVAAARTMATSKSRVLTSLGLDCKLHSTAPRPFIYSGWDGHYGFRRKG